MDAETAYKVQVLRYVTIACSVLASWEHLIWMKSEVIVWYDFFTWLSRLCGKESSPKIIEKAAAPLTKNSTGTYASSSGSSPPIAKFFVLAVRYTLLICVILSYLFYQGRPSDCMGIFTAMWALFALCWICSAAIFLLRVYLIWEKNKRILTFFLLLWICTIAGWVYDVAQYRVLRLDDIPAPEPWCTPAPDSKFRAFCWGLCLLFDTCILIATVVKLRQPDNASQFGRSATVKKYLLRSNLIYFFIAFTVNATCFVVELAVPDVVLSHIPSPFAFALNPIIAVRTIFGAEQYIRNEMRHSYLPTTTTPTARLSTPTQAHATLTGTSPSRPGSSSTMFEKKRQESLPGFQLSAISTPSHATKEIMSGSSYEVFQDGDAPYSPSSQTRRGSTISSPSMSSSSATHVGRFGWETEPRPDPHW